MTLKIDERLLIAAEGANPKEVKETSPGRLLDLMVLVLAIDAYTLAGDNTEHLNKGLAVYRMHRSSIEEAAKKHLESIIQRPDASILESKFRFMDQPDPTRKARFVEDFMVWVKRRTSLMRDIFPGRVYANASKVAVACEEPDVEARVQKLSVVPTSSGLSSMFKWVRKSAELLGAPAPTVEAVSAQVESAQAIAEELKDTDRRINVEPVGSPARAELEDKKLNLAADLNEAVEDSDDPQTVGAAAASRYAAQSKVSAKFGLTPEQEDVMRSMGNVVIAAGAGSGKTQTLVATIAHLVEEKGYQPGQIMACSFTRAAASELDSRVTERAGIHGVRVGTTHSIAREIIIKNRPQLVQAVNKNKQARMAFKLAMRQVPLSISGYQEGLNKSRDNMQRIESIPGWRDTKILKSFYDQLSRGWALSEKQQSVLDNWRSGGGYYRRRYAEEDASVVQAVRTAMGQTGMVVDAAYDSVSSGGDSGSPYWTTPVGEWFNIGLPVADENGKPLSEKQALLLVDNFKNSGQSVDQVRSERGDDCISSLYGAYEWLKKNDKVFGPCMDYTDQLTVALQILKEDPAARAAEQRRFKALMVDEAQDLNEIQFEMFQILGEKADLLAFIGDDKQCVSSDTLISTPDGTKEASLLRDGDQVLSFRNGELRPQVVHINPSSWTWGYRITTESGKTLTMSPNHKIWADDLQLEGDQMIVYLMYRRDMGFRVGVTNKSGGEEDYLNRFGGRAFLEKAERLWVLEVCNDREEALLAEESYSLKYGVPTSCFEGEHRGLNQSRITSLFSEFGENGLKILQSKHLSFNLPHWMSRSYSKHGRIRRTIQMIAHSPTGTQVTLEWMGDDLDEVTQSYKVANTSKGTKRIRKWFGNYREGLVFAEALQEATKANLARRLSTAEGPLNLLTASALFPGMKVPVLEGSNLIHEAIISVEKVEGTFLDLDVTEASNFFGGGILSHNSIYAFRGAKPKNYVDLSKKEGFQTKLMTLNFRSGKAIVDAANKLIAHNGDRQIPMVCEADVELKGMGSIRSKSAATHEDAANMVAQEIKDAIDSGDSPKDFGILVRNNAEHDAYTLALLARGIPYRLLTKSSGGYFGKPLVRALTAWMRLIVGGSDSEINEALIDAHMTPGFGLNKGFAENLARNARGKNYLDYIMSGGQVYFGSVDWLNKRVMEYANVIRTIRISGGMDSPSLIRAILGVKGIKGTFEESLIKLVDEDELVEEEGVGGAEALRNAAMAPLNPLMIMAENFKDPGNLLGFVQKMKAANEKAQKETPEKKEDWKEPAVLVGTVHGWKGLQAKHCYVCMSGGIFPNFRTAEKEAEGDVTAFDEERRLAYVAITRAEQSVTVMAPQKNYLGKPAPVSRFIGEACIPIVGEKGPEQPVGKNEEELAIADPKQELALESSPEDPFAEFDKTARSGSGAFASTLIAFAYDIKKEASDEYLGECDCEGACKESIACEGECKEGEGCKADGGVTCPCNYDYRR